MKSAITECAMLLMAVTVWADLGLARTHLNCITKKVVIVDAPSGSTSSSIEESFGFWIDEAEKTLVLVDGTPLTVRRFDERWISAARGDVFYELDRQSGNLAYASSTTKDGTATIIIGSGRCTSRSDGVSRLHASQFAFPRDSLMRLVHALYPVLKFTVSLG